MSLSINNDKYLQPDEPEANTYEIGFSVHVTFAYVTNVDAFDEDQARELFDQQIKSMAQKAVDQGDQTDLETDVDYISER
jgi:hypothetical protein